MALGEQVKLQHIKCIAEEAVRDSALQMRRASNDLLFLTFVHERIRLPMTVEERKGCFTEPSTTNKIKTIVTSWKKDKKVEILTSYVIERLTEMFGKPMNEKEWPLFKVFAADEFVEEWDSRFG